MSVIPAGAITDVRPIDYAQRAEKQAQAAQQAHLMQQQLPTVLDVDPVDAAEELSFSIAHRGRTVVSQQETAQSSFTLDLRALARLVYRINRLKGLNAAFDQAFWKGEVAQRGNDKLNMARDDDTVESLTDSGSEDPFKQYVYLMEARQLARHGEPAAKKLDDALARVWDNHQSTIVAGFNTMKPMVAFAKDLQEWDKFRAIYLECVVSGDLGRTFKALLDKFGAGRLRQSIATLRNAIAADLASPIVSADKDRWQREYLDLMDNRRISSLIASTSDFCQELRVGDPQPDVVMGFVGGVLDFVAAPNDRKFNALCAVLVPEEELNEVIRMKVRSYLKKYLPLWLWSSPEARDQMLFHAPPFRTRS